MQKKIFSLIGGRRMFAALATTVVTFVAEAFFDAEAAKRITDVVLYIMGAFVLGESAADGLGRLANGKKG